MKSLGLVVTLLLSCIFASPIVAAAFPSTQVDCEHAGMKWSSGKCHPPSDKPMIPKDVQALLGVIGIGCSLAGTVILCLKWREGANGDDQDRS